MSVDYFFKTIWLQWFTSSFPFTLVSNVNILQKKIDKHLKRNWFKKIICPRYPLKHLIIDRSPFWSGTSNSSKWHVSLLILFTIILKSMTDSKRFQTAKNIILTRCTKQKNQMINTLSWWLASCELLSSPPIIIGYQSSS